MGSYNRDDRSAGGYRGGFSRGGGRGGFRGGRSSFGGGRGDREMFSAICSNCGKEAQVPFRPTGSKPVYCSECFEKMGSGERTEARRFEQRDRFPQPQGGPDLTAINTKLENINSQIEKILNILNAKPAVKEEKAEVSDEVKKIEKKIESPKAKKSAKKTTSPKTAN